MSLPFFFVEDFNNNLVVLNEETSKHMINVLRMAQGEEILLTNGKGKKARAAIVDDNRKKCTVQISSIETEVEKPRKVAIGISLIKNASRFEWFLKRQQRLE